MGNCCYEIAQHRIESKKNGALRKRRPARYDKPQVEHPCLDETELKQYLNAIFDKYDPDHNGVLDQNELKQMFRDINSSHGKNLPENEVDAYVRTIMNKAANKEEVTREDFYHFYKDKY
jgi:Ca2+-binding EF-hand superfamily protein